MLPDQHTHGHRPENATHPCLALLLESAFLVANLEARSMTRYRDTIPDEAVERAYPFHVVMKVPPDGFGDRLDAMYDFHTHESVTVRRGVDRREGGRNIIRWCFVEAEIARKFATAFSDCLGRN
jgi:hypothetical protein